MKWVKRTRFFVVAIVLVVAVYDLAASAFGGYEATISRYALDFPSAVVFGLGFAFGHMFWPQSKPEKRLWEKLTSRISRTPEEKNLRVVSDGNSKAEDH